MGRVLVSLLLAGVAGGSLGCGAAASGVGRAAVGAGARTGARAATVTVPKVVVPNVPRAVAPAVGGAAKAGGQATEHSGGFGEHLMQELGQQAVTRALRRDDDRQKK